MSDETTSSGEELRTSRRTQKEILSQKFFEYEDKHSLHEIMRDLNSLADPDSEIRIYRLALPVTTRELEKLIDLPIEVTIIKTRNYCELISGTDTNTGPISTSFYRGERYGQDGIVAVIHTHEDLAIDVDDQGTPFYRSSPSINDLNDVDPQHGRFFLLSRKGITEYTASRDVMDRVMQFYKRKGIDALGMENGMKSLSEVTPDEEVRLREEFERENGFLLSESSWESEDMQSFQDFFTILNE